MPTPDYVLLSWIARNNDPYVRRRDDSFVVDDSGSFIPGPTLGVLFDEDSPYRGKISDVVLLARLYQEDGKKDIERRIVRETKSVIQERDGSIQIHDRYWKGKSPVDHGTIFAFLRDRLPQIRLQFAGRPLLINVSPGTPAMHTVWVLMAETGYIDPPFEIVQGIPKQHREKGQGATVPVDVGIETFYKTYQRTHPEYASTEVDEVRWDLTRARSDKLVALRDEAMRMAGVKVPVLILGERGTGKTTLAAWIRAHSTFRNPKLDAHWPMVSCGQFTPELMRSEIFGHRKGAFTGADDDYTGIASKVDGDTLFLDEIGDVARVVQRLLIRALEEKTFTPLGSTKPEQSDFRLITATNRPWHELSDRLDADFLDRISLFRLRMPSLREIPEDLDWMWEDIFKQAVSRAGSPSISLRPKDHKRIIEALQAHPLPGNLRDPYRIAYYLIAAISDPRKPMDYEGAVTYALEQGLMAESAGMDFDTPTRQIVRAYLEYGTLDGVLDVQGTIETKTVDDNIRRFLGEEIRRLARQRDVDPEEICDVSKRTLLNWVG